MKYLSLGLFVAHLIFTCVKSLIMPVSFIDLGVLVCLLILVIGDKVYKVIHRKNYRDYLIKRNELELKKPFEEDEEIVTLKTQNEIEALKLRKFMTEQEYHKREIARTVDQQVGEGGIRF